MTREHFKAIDSEVINILQAVKKKYAAWDNLRGAIRTRDNRWCPLQVLAGSEYWYVNAVVALGFSRMAAKAVMAAADNPDDPFRQTVVDILIGKTETP